MNPIQSLLLIPIEAILIFIATKLGIDASQNHATIVSIAGTVTVSAVSGLAWLAMAGWRWWQHTKLYAQLDALQGENAQLRKTVSGAGRACGILFVIGLALMFIPGCANPAAQLQPQIAGADGSAIAGVTLVRNHELSAASGAKLSTDLHAADAGFGAAIGDIQAGGSTAEATAAQILASLQAVADDLAGTPSGAKAAVKIRAKLAATNGKKRLAASAVITLIDLVLELEPGVASEINYLFGGTVPTVADCQAALSKFETDLAALDSAVASLGG